MIITPDTKSKFLHTLDRSIQEGLERGAFCLYLPTEDRILYTVLQEELDPSEVIMRTPNFIRYSEDLTERIKSFNEGRIPNVSVGAERFSRKDGVIIGYHVHHKEEVDITPSKEDRDFMKLDSSIPVEIILSEYLAQFWPQSPFVAGYLPEHFPKDQVPAYQGIPITQVAEEAKKAKVDAKVIFDLGSCYSRTGLLASVNFSVIPKDQ